MLHRYVLSVILLLSGFLLISCGDFEEVELRQIRNITADVSDQPILKAEAVFYNPNKQEGKLKSVHVDVYIEGKKAASIDQRFKIKVPSKGEFTVPLQAAVNLKEQGLVDKVLSIIGAKKIKVHYKGSVLITHRGIPIRVAVDEETEVRLRF